jgi:WD40 repeat protein
MVRRELVALGFLAALGGTATAQPRFDSLGDTMPPGAVARLGTLRLQHPVGDVIEAVVYSTDGKLLATRARVSGVRIWDAASGKELRRIDAPQDTSASNLAFEPGGIALAAGADNEVRVWNAETGALLKTYRGGKARVLAVCFADGGKAIAAFAADGTARWWDRDSGKVTRELTLPRPKAKGNPEIHSAVFAPGAMALAMQYGGYDREAHPDVDPNKQDRNSEMLVHDLGSGKLIWSGRAQQERRMIVAFAADGKRFAVAVAHWQLDLGWHLDVRDTATGGSLASATLESYPSREPRDEVAAAAFAPGGTSIAFVREGWSVAVWDQDDRSIISRTPTRGPSDYDRPRCAAYSPDGKRLAVGVNHVLHLRDAVTLREWFPYPVPRGGVLEVLFTAQGRRVVARAEQTRYGDPDGFAWEAGTWKQQAPLLAARWERFVSGDPSGAGDVEVTGEGDTWIFLHPRTGKRLGALDTKSRKAGDGYTGTFSPRGTVFQRLFQMDGAPRSTVKLFAVPSGKQLGEIFWSGGGAMAFSDDEQLFAVCDAHEGRVYVLDLATGKERKLSAASEADHWRLYSSLAFSADGKLLAAWSKSAGEVVVWDVATGKERCRAKAPPRKGDYPPRVCVALSPDGKTLAAGGVEGDSTVRLFEVETGKARGSLTGHQGIVQCLTFSPDGRLLLSGSADATVLVWDTLTGPGQ